MVSSLTQVGVITAAHGVRGQVKIRSLTVSPEHITELGILTDATGNKQYEIKFRPAALPLFIADIKGITDRNAAELLKGTKLYASSEIVVAPESPFIGKAVLTNNGSPYGTVIGIANYGAGDVAEIEKTDGTQEMLPLHANFLVIKEDKITVFPPEYLESGKE